jgi:preprotein translocase subunit SecA
MAEKSANYSPELMRMAEKATAKERDTGTTSRAAAAAPPPATAPTAVACARPARAVGRAPRNAPYPCGSGKKFKHCHGRV